MADKRIKRALEGVKDIGAVTLVGQRKREIQIAVDPEPARRVRALDPADADGPPAAERGGPGRAPHRRGREEGLRTLGRMSRRGGLRDDRGRRGPARAGPRPRRRRGPRRRGGAADAVPPGRGQRRLAPGPQAVGHQHRGRRRPRQGAAGRDPGHAAAGHHDRDRPGPVALHQAGARRGAAPPPPRRPPGEPDRVGLPRLAELAARPDRRGRHPDVDHRDVLRHAVAGFTLNNLTMLGLSCRPAS